MWLDQDFPIMLGAELHRPSPTYVAELCIEPTVVWDYSKQGGQTVQLDRYAFWNQPGSKESRERTPDQTIGTANSRNITKQKVLVTLREYTGPADPTDPDSPAAFKVSRENLMTAQRMFLDTNNLTVFHNSIGSLTLLDDYRRWRDRVFILELYKSYSRGQSSGTQGGYYFPGELSEAQIASPGYTVSGAGDEDKARFSVKNDLLAVVRDLHKRNVPAFADGYYRALVDPEFMTHMRQDKDFREIARYPGMGAPNPMGGFAAPNAINFQGSFAGYGQAGSVAGSQTMPTGFLFEQVRFFVTTNMPEYSYNVAINGATGFSGSTPKVSRAAVGMFFGMQAIGLGIGGNNAQVLINGNDDYGRFISLIWNLMAGWEVLNYDFTTVAHSFIYAT
jgi:hypothetical protein